MESENTQLAIMGEKNTPMFVTTQMQTLEGVMKYAQVVLDSKLAPKHFYDSSGNGKPEAVVMVIDRGLSVGMSPSMALQQIVPINGLTTIKGDGAKALIMASGKVDSWKTERIGEGAEFKVKITAKRKDTGEELTSEFSVGKAKRAGLWITDDMAKNNTKLKYSPWYKYPDRMVYYRALGFICRDLFGDVIHGMHIQEEIQDVDYEIVDTPKGEVKVSEENLGKGEVAVKEAIEKAKKPIFEPKEDVKIEDESNLPSEETTPTIEDPLKKLTLDELKVKVKGIGLNLPKGRGAANMDTLRDMINDPDKYRTPKKEIPTPPPVEKTDTKDIVKEYQHEPSECEEKPKEEEKPESLKDGMIKNVFLLLSTTTLPESDKDTVKKNVESMDLEGITSLCRHLEENQPKKEEPEQLSSQNKPIPDSNSLVESFKLSIKDINPGPGRSFNDQQVIRRAYTNAGISTDNIRMIVMGNNLAEDDNKLIESGTLSELCKVVEVFSSN